MVSKLGAALLAAAVAVLLASGLYAETVLVPGAAPGKEIGRAHV